MPTLSTQHLLNLQPPVHVYSSHLCSEIARATLLNSCLFNSIVMTADFLIGGKRKRDHSPVFQALIDYVRLNFQVLIKKKINQPQVLNLVASIICFQHYSTANRTYKNTIFMEWLKMTELGL